MFLIIIFKMVDIFYVNTRSKLSYPELVGHNFNSFLLILRVTNARYPTT